jgi:putative transposase
MLRSEYPINLLCDLLAISRSSFYYQPTEADETELREAVNQIAAQSPTYGSVCGHTKVVLSMLVNNDN